MKRGKPLQAKTPMRKVSAKKRSRKAEEKAAGAWEHMAAVKALPCCACGASPPSQAHHVTGDKQPRSDWRVIPLCYDCHQGPHGYHAAKRSWVDRHGPDYEFLKIVQMALDGQR
jgi:hypothetical protein